MPPLEASAAAATATHMDVEPTHQGLAGDFHLGLLIHVIFFGESSAVGTLVGQPHIDDLVGFLFGKWAMDLGAIVGARLAARGLRGLLGCSLGTRSGLTLACPLGLFQQRGELTHLGLQGIHPHAELPVFFPQPLVLINQVLVRRRGHDTHSRCSFDRDFRERQHKVVRPAGPINMGFFRRKSVEVSQFYPAPPGATLSLRPSQLPIGEAGYRAIRPLLLVRPVVPV